MDLDEPIESLRERAASSEPASSRPKPFDDDDDDQSSSRKRQRMESDNPENMSAAESASTVNDEPAEMSSPTQEAVLPTTPTRNAHLVTTPNSNKVTLNLRSTRDLELIPSTIHSPPTPSKAPANDSEPANMDKSNESEVDANNIHPTIETPSSSLSSGEPEVMLVESEYFSDSNPTVAIIDDDDIISEHEVGDQTYEFPFLDTSGTLQEAALRLANHFENANMNGPSNFTKLHLWIAKYVKWARRNPDEAFTSYCDNKEFWDGMYDVIRGLSCRKPHFGNWLKTDAHARNSLSYLLQAFGSLAGQFVAMDHRTLLRCKENPDMPMVIASRNFLEALYFLLYRLEQEHVGQYLVLHYNWNWDEELSNIYEALERQGATLRMFIEITKMCLDMAPRLPKLIDNLRETCRFVLLSLRFSRLEDRVAFHAQDYARRILSAYSFFELVQGHLRTFIEKHATYLSSESVLGQLAALTDILEIVMELKNGPAESLLQETESSDPDLPAKFLPKAAAYRWKFSVLIKLITSSQMQLRVGGTASFCIDLLAIYAARGQSSPEQHPLLRNIARFIVSTDIVEYIVGVGSHPEIIAQSWDMVGFLAVTKTYTNYHTDKIWSTIQSSLDPRVVESVVNLLARTLNLLPHQDRLYICKKLQEIPVESFTVVMRGFCDQLFSELLKEARLKSLDLEAPPYDVCVRLICDSTVPRADSPMAFNEVQQWASIKFEFLTKREGQFATGPDTAVRREIYKRCLDDLRNKKNADGSLIAISILVESNIMDLRQLIGEPDFIQLVIENFSWRKNPHGISKHFLLFQHIIEMDFIKDSSNLGLQLWNKIIGAEETDSDRGERQSGWKMLARLIKPGKTSVKPGNAFVKACVLQYLPSLPPRLFSKASFDFAREAIGCLDTGESLELHDNVSVIDVNGVEELWRMVWTSHDNPVFQHYAIHELIRFYIDSSTINSLPRDKILEMHLDFVDRCLNKLTTAAGTLKSFSEGTTSGDDEPMIIVVSDEEVHQQELLFCRSLFLLKGFLRTHELSSRFAPTKVQPQIVTPPEAVKGEVMNVSYQVFDEKTNSPVRKLDIGNLNTGASLFGSLQKASGFQHLRVYHCGTEVTASEFDLSKSLRELQLGTHLMIVQRIANPSSWSERSSVQLEVMKHFDGIFELLAMDSAQAKDIYDFLVYFPAYDKLLDALRSEDTSCEELFPGQYPYKSLYAMHTLHTFIREQSKEQHLDQHTKPRCLSLLIETLSSHEFLASHTDEDCKLSFCIKLLESLGYLLAEPALREHLESRSNSKILLDRFIILLTDNQKSSSKYSTTLLLKAFKSLELLSTISPCFWAEFKEHPETVQLVQGVLLGEVAVNPKDGQFYPATIIVHACGTQTSSTAVSQTEFLQFFWPLLADLVPKAILHPERCEPVLSLVEGIFRTAVDISRARGISFDRLNLGALAHQWGELLLSHKVIQYVGRPTIIDYVALGLSSLLKTCIQYMALAELEPLRPLATELFNKHLFPDLPVPLDIDDSARLDHQLPLLDTTTRQFIVEVILALVKDDEQSYMTLMKRTTNLVPPPEEEGNYVYDMLQCFDRSRVIRSATGYVGLKNLSNTCYLNSLMTQLFMNVSFREFMLHAHVAEGSSQKLLQQTQKLFGEMQNSVMRCADPSELAQSIRTYEDSNIDVTVQMDVDEFYNLLFDRWESQILAPDGKAAFRSFYGGQLVQQVKSKECAHISERLEPFSAIQCDIKGKATLKESLEAYVDGEIMEGDNKYKCSTCDQHVDAVKRACLKDVPDNLIFHLKRFDYNLREGRRNKLNDYFSFPNEIDMRPYKVDYLTQGPEGSEEDVFELVGVLVHSGTAESGHYYSYIRERPSRDGKSWVEFNDDSVIPFDPSNIEGCCFGGVSYQTNNNEYQFDKNYSAYMLFYQRKSFLIEQKQKLGHMLGAEPIKLPIHPTEAGLIGDDNSLQMRKYVLYDPSHAYFVKQLLSGLPQASGDGCSSGHVLENQALIMTFNHMDQVFARAKDAPDFENFVQMLKSMFEHCSACSKCFLTWVIASPEACRQFLVKSPDAFVRSGVANLIIIALRTLKRDAPEDYGMDENNQRSATTVIRSRVSAHKFDPIYDLNRASGIFGLVVGAIRQQCDNVLVVFRAWPEYFDLVGQMMDGMHEAALLVDNGFLKRAFEIITADYHMECSQEIGRMLNVISRRSANRPIPYEGVISLTKKFLEAMDSLAVDHTKTFRTFQHLRGQPLKLWPEENSFLTLFWTSAQDNIFIGALYKLNVNEPATHSILKQVLLKMDDPDGSLKKNILLAITEFLHKNQSSYAPGPCLKGALIFCKYTDWTHLKAMVERIQKYAGDSEVFGGEYFLQFFRDLMTLPSHRFGKTTQQLEEYCIDQIANWAPSLLVNYEPNVRQATEEYLSQTVFKFGSALPDSDDEDGPPYHYLTCHAAAQVLGISCLEHLDDYFIRHNMQVLKNNLQNIRAVSEACKPYYEEGSDMQSRYFELSTHVWINIQRLAVNRLDDEGSAGSDDWDQSDGDLSTSSLVGDDRDPVSLIDGVTDL